MANLSRQSQPTPPPGKIIIAIIKFVKDHLFVIVLILAALGLFGLAVGIFGWKQIVDLAMGLFGWK
jgi:hypothetical protein